MVNILCIGKYREGKFSTIQWKCFLEWCKKECNKIIVYSHMPYNIICAEFPLYCDIIKLEKPDKVLNVYAYEINIINVLFWNYIEDYNYDIDKENDISHMFFFQKGKYIASLEIVDYENYILIEDFIKQKDIFFAKEELILENNRLCFEGKSDIDELLQEEKWRPLGGV